MVETASYGLKPIAANMGIPFLDTSVPTLRRDHIYVHTATKHFHDQTI